MRYLRYVLLACNLGAVLFVLIIVKYESRGEAWPFMLLGFVVALLPAANFIYLLDVAPANASRFGFGRIGRLMRLWLDAKEADLTKRAAPKG